MNLKSILNKAQSGLRLVLAQPTMLFRNKETAQLLATHVVKEDEVCRPDLIAIEHYGNQSMLDIILKFNNISDPFSLKPGEELKIPISTIPYYKLDRPGVVEDNVVKDEFVKGKRLNKKDQARLDALKKKYNKEVLLPPNVIPVGKKNYKFDKDGTVTFGAQAQNDEVQPANDPVVDEIMQDVVVTPTEGASSISGSGIPGEDINVTSTELQLENQSGQSSGSGSGGGRGIDTGKADETATNNEDGTAPQGQGQQPGVGGDSPCS